MEGNAPQGAVTRRRLAIRKALRTLMTGLYFPAVLGSGVVFLLLLFSHSEPWSSAFHDFRFWVGLLFVMFFSFSFFTITEAKDSDYKLPIFLCDFAESLLVFWALGVLGLYETPPLQPHRTTAYWLFLAVIILENVWALQIMVRSSFPVAVLVSTPRLRIRRLAPFALHVICNRQQMVGGASQTVEVADHKHIALSDVF